MRTRNWLSFWLFLQALSFVIVATSILDGTSLTASNSINTTPTASPTIASSTCSIEPTSSSKDVPSKITSTTPSGFTAASAAQDTVPGMISESCYGGPTVGDGPPCVATCKENDSACRSAASSIVATCKPQWDMFDSIQRKLVSTPSNGLWSWITTTNHYSYGSGSLRTITWSVYTKVSTVRSYSYVNVAGSTITPVYALGQPSMTESEVPNPGYTATFLTGPTPTCRYNYVAWTADGTLAHLNSQIITMTCGQCSLHGGEVQLYWWPSTSTASAGTKTRLSSSLEPPMTTVVDGITLTSPTVYVSLHNLSASDSCSVVGSTITSTLIAMDPTDISTLVHIGGKVAQSNANQYGPLNFTQLTGLPPASAYEQQPDCVYVGCPTIYPTPINYTIVVPSQVRSMDPAWANCAAGLEGLYDPPIALRGQPNINAAPKLTMVSNSATKTWTMLSSTLLVNSRSTKSLGDILHTSLDNSAIGMTSQSGRVGKSKPTATSSSGGEPQSSKAAISRHGRSESGIGHTSSTDSDSQHSKVLHASSGPGSSSSENVAVSRSRMQFGSQDSDASSTSPSIDISTDSKGQYVVNGRTFLPGMDLTLTRKGSPITFQMFTTGTQTYIAIGTSTTVALADGDRNGDSTVELPAPLEFTRASNGDFVLNGTTLTSGRPVTLGSGASKTTLEITTMQRTPAVIIDGTLTRKLGHHEASSFGVPSASLPAVTTPAGPPKTTPSVPAKTSSTVTSNCTRFDGFRPRCALMLFAVTTMLVSAV